MSESLQEKFRESMLPIGVSAVIIIAIAAGIIISRSTEQEEEIIVSEPVVEAPIEREVIAPEPVLQTTPIAPEVIEEAVPELPAIISAPDALDGSDDQVLLALGDFSPTLMRWLLPKEQIRKWVLAVDLMADGKLPKRYRPIDYPMAKYVVQADGAETYTPVDTNFERMQPLIKVLTEIDTDLLARYYRAWLPILEKAYSEQGKADSFDQRLSQAMDRVLQVDPLSETAILTRPSVLYRYESELLESASDVEKLLWRMGEDNATDVQLFIRDLRHSIRNS